MNDALLTGIIGLVGVVLGWVLNWWTTRRQERKREEQERRGVRLLLRQECKHNVAALCEFWGTLAREGVHVPEAGMLLGIGTSWDEGEFDKRQRLAREPLPVWRHLMWESQAGLAAIALSPAEIDRVYALYADLEAFTARRAELRKEYDSPEGKQLADEYTRWMLQRFQGRLTSGTSAEEQHIYSALHAFNVKTSTFWEECNAIYLRALPYKDNIHALIEEDTPIRRLRDRLMERLPRRAKAAEKRHR